MRTSLAIGALAVTALLSGTASATEIVVSKSRLVIDVEYWGRLRVVSENPDGSGKDIISYGSPVHGSFRVFADDAPPPLAPRGLSSFDGKVYGQRSDGTLPTGASFVTSRYLSPFPSGATHQVSPFDGSVGDDFVAVGDRVHVHNDAGGPKDWFQVSDGFAPSSVDDRVSGERVEIVVRSPLDFLDGFGLDQAFELNDLQEKEDTWAAGFFRAKIGEAAVASHRFFVDRIRVSPHVCKP